MTYHVLVNDPPPHALAIREVYVESNSTGTFDCAVLASTRRIRGAFTCGHILSSYVNKDVT